MMIIIHFVKKIGNTDLGDGYKYRGRGIWQLTGKWNYTEFNTFYQGKYGTTIDLVQNPDLVATNVEIAVISALWYYKNRVTIKIDENTTVEDVTLKVNGGDKGLSDRQTQYLNVKNNIKNCR